MDENIEKQSPALNRQEEADKQIDAAADAATIEAARRHEAELTALDARIDANQSKAEVRELETNQRILHDNLEHEREVSSTNAFGFYLMTAVLLALVLVGGMYYYWRSQQPIQAAPSPPYSGPVRTMPAPSTSVPVVPSTP